MSGETGDIDKQIAARVRDLRLAKGLTLDALAQSSGVSRAMLSRIERGESSPTAQLMTKICRGLEIPIAALFASVDEAASPVVRHAEQAVWRDPASGYLRRTVFSRGGGSAVDIAEIDFPAGGSIELDSLQLATATMHVWVLDGTLEFEAGDEIFRLGAGDCLMVRLDLPTRFRNPTRKATRYAVITNMGTGT